MKVVLIIDDDPNWIELLQPRLAAKGLGVLIAMTAEAGIEVALRALPSLILCDLRMEPTDGYMFAKACKRDDILRRIPLVAVTNASLSDTQIGAIGVGYDGVIEKTDKELVQKILTLLKWQPK